MTLKVKMDVLVSSPSEGIYSPTSGPHIADKIAVRSSFSFLKKHADHLQNMTAMIDITSTVKIKYAAGWDRSGECGGISQVSLQPPRHDILLVNSLREIFVRSEYFTNAATKDDPMGLK